MMKGKEFRKGKSLSVKNSKISFREFYVETKKEYWRRGWPGFFLSVIALCFAFSPVGYGYVQQAGPTTSETTQYGYYYKDKFIPLTPSKGLIAVSETEVAFGPFVRAQGLQRDPLSERKQLKGRKLGLYRIPAPAGKSEKRMDFPLQMERLARTTAGEIQPVFEQGQTLLIPANEVIVRLKETSTLERAQSFFARYRNTQDIVEVKEHRKNTYILRIDNPSNGRVYQVCQFLAELEEIDFAEPNHITVLLDAPTVPMPPGGASSSRSQGEGVVGGPTGNSPVNWTVLANESFEGASLPAGWSTGRMSNTNADAFWSLTNFRSHSGSQSVYATSGGTQGVPPPGDYPNNSFSWLNTPPVDLASYDEVYIELWFYAKFEEPSGSCTVPDLGLLGIQDPSLGTTTYLGALAVCYTGDLTADPTTDNGWRRALFRVPPALRLNGVNVRVVFVSDSSGNREGLYIDQLRVVGTTDVDTEPVGNDTYGARLYEMKNAGQIAGLGNDNNDTQVTEAWDLVSVSSDVVVAVVDSGVDLTHPDLNLVTGYDPDGTVGGGPRGSHGTAVAGNVGAIGDNSLGVLGMAPCVKIMPVYMGSSFADIADAIDEAVAHGADVLSNSWGWVGSPSADIEGAINDALNAKRVVLFAAGNGPDRPPWTYEVAFPGSLTGTTDVITVGASSPTDEHKAAASSDGSFGWGSSYIGDGPDIVAPSPWSYTTDRQGAAGYHDGSLIDPSDLQSADYTPTFGGTSSATPKVAGIVALMLSANPDLTPHQVKEILRETAEDIDVPGVDDKTGAGRVNAKKAVERARPPSENGEFEYAAKLVCGLQKDPKGMRLARGFYATAVNIHNPNAKAVKLKKKLALTFPPKEQRPGKVMPIGTDKLGPDQALEVDCEDIQSKLFPNGFEESYIKGFVIIQSTASLDVTAVYTTASLDREGNITNHSSIDVEQIKERQVRMMEPEHADLIPVPHERGDFCRIRDGKLVVIPKNQGRVAAGRSNTQVDFFQFGKFTVKTPNLAPGASTELLFNIPRGCYDPDCHFKITVDSTSVILESDEGNNTASSFCLG